ncbi:MAG: AlpA family phage regulatory protein [Rhizobiaceae bacterium]
MPTHQNKISTSWQGIPASTPLLRPSQVLKETAISRSTMYEMIARGDFPSFIKIGRRSTAMPRVWLDAFVASCCETDSDINLKGISHVG